MEIEICKTAGLCKGAERAFKTAEDLIANGKTVKLFKRILHNENIISLLQQQGAKVIEDVCEVKKDDVVILKAHGELKKVKQDLVKKRSQVVDCVCPNVEKVKNLAIKKQADGYCIIVIGKQKNGVFHEETQALCSYLDNKILISAPEDIEGQKFERQKYFALCQTTFPQQLFFEIIEKLKKRVDKLEFANTICNFTAENIKQSMLLAQSCNLCIVLGSKTSSNTTELYNNLKEISPTIFENDIQAVICFVKQFVNVHGKDVKIGIFAGASTLKSTLKELKQKIQNEFLE